MDLPEHFTYQPNELITITLVEVPAVDESYIPLLHPNDRSRLDVRIHHPEKRREFIASRMALLAMKPQYMLHYQGRCPILDGRGFISLAHSPQFGAAIHHPTRRVGIDVEPHQYRLRKIAPKILNESEMEDISFGDSQFKLQILWGAKESLFKLHRMGGIEFKKHMFVDPIPDRREGTLKAYIRSETENISCNIGYFMHGAQYVVYAVMENPI